MIRLVSIFVMCFLSILYFIPSNSNAAWNMFLNDSRHTGRSLSTIPGEIEQLWFNQSHQSYEKHFSVAEDGTLYMVSGHYIYALNQNDGSAKWQYNADNTITGTAAIDSNGNIYFGSKDNYIHSLSASGVLRWKFLADGDVKSSVVITTTDIIYATTAGRLYKLSANGSSLWETNGESGAVQGLPYGSASTPAVGSDGTVYVVNGGKLFSINELGTENWSTIAPELDFSSPVIGDNGVIYCAAGHMAMDGDYALHAFNPETGEINWSFPLGDMPYTHNPTIAQDGTIYITAADLYLYAINPNGTLKWKFLGDDELYDCIIDANDVIVVLAKSNTLYRINPDGIPVDSFFSYDYQNVNFRPDYVIGNSGQVFIGHDKGAWAFGEPRYSFSADRIVLVRGQETFPNDFNDEGFTDDHWIVDDGTAVMTGGFLTLKSPGSTDQFEQNGFTISKERSSVKAGLPSEILPVQEGDGDLDLELEWKPIFPEQGQGYGMMFHYPPSDIDQVRIGIDNYDAHVLSLLGAPEATPAGTYISFIQISPDPGPNLYNLTFEYQSSSAISPEDITGNIIFKLFYNDNNNSFSASYSMDGGQSFQQFSTSYTIPSLSGDIDPFVELEAGSFVAQLISCQYGDINGDDVVDLKDVISGLQVLSGIDTDDLCVDYEVNDDAWVSLDEVLDVLLRIVQ